MKAYADTNFFMRLYLPTPDLARVSRKVFDYLRLENEPLPFTPLHRLEFRNAIRLMVYRRRQPGELPLAQPQARQILRANEDDLAERIFVTHLALDWTDALREAERLSAAHTETGGYRALDLLHVGSALGLGREEFCSFDRDARRMAALGGLRVWPDTLAD
jgi:predicted nucleic acid-binding protein